MSEGTTVWAVLGLDLVVCAPSGSSTITTPFGTLKKTQVKFLYFVRAPGTKITKNKNLKILTLFLS